MRRWLLASRACSAWQLRHCSIRRSDACCSLPVSVRCTPPVSPNSIPTNYSLKVAVATSRREASDGLCERRVAAGAATTETTSSLNVVPIWVIAVLLWSGDYSIVETTAAAQRSSIAPPAFAPSVDRADRRGPLSSSPQPIRAPSKCGDRR